MGTRDLLIGGSLMTALLIYMMWLAWRQGILLKMLVDFFQSGAGYGIAVGLFLNGSLYWYALGFGAIVPTCWVVGIIFAVLEYRLSKASDGDKPGGGPTIWKKINDTIFNWKFFSVLSVALFAAARTVYLKQGWNQLSIFLAIVGGVAVLEVITMFPWWFRCTVADGCQDAGG